MPTTSKHMLATAVEVIKYTYVHTVLLNKLYVYTCIYMYAVCTDFTAIFILLC